jgi:O-acetylhomoserine (thiol)-lyase
VRIEGLRDYGAALSPFNASDHSRIRNITRVQKHSENGLALAEWLETQDQVAWVITRV